MAPSDLVYPFGLGLLAAVNPCGFPLLPVYLDLFVGRPGREPTVERLQRAVVAGGFATLGFVLLFGVLGIVSQLGFSVLSSRVPFAAAVIMVVLGVGMAVVGVLSLLHRPLRVRLPELGPGAGLRRPAALTVFGVSYGVASIGCSLPLFVAAVAGSFSRQGALYGTGSFIAYALGMGTLLAAMALVTATLGPAGVRSLRRVSRLVPAVGGAVLVLVGSYLALYWLTDLVAPGHSSPPLHFVESVQAGVASFVGAHVDLLGAGLGALVVAAVVAGSLAVPRDGRGSTGGQDGASGPGPADRGPDPTIEGGGLDPASMGPAAAPSPSGGSDDLRRRARDLPAGAAAGWTAGRPMDTRREAE